MALLESIQYNVWIHTHSLYSSYNLLSGSRRKSLERPRTRGSKLTEEVSSRESEQHLELKCDLIKEKWKRKSSTKDVIFSTFLLCLQPSAELLLVFLYILYFMSDGTKGKDMQQKVCSALVYNIPTNISFDPEEHWWRQGGSTLEPCTLVIFNSYTLNL